jgi:hypothetical protein
MSDTHAAFLCKGATWYKSVNIQSRILACSFFPKYPELLKELNGLVQIMDIELDQVSRKYQKQIIDFLAPHQESIREYEKTAFVQEKINEKAAKTIASASADASELILKAHRTKRAEIIKRMQNYRDECNIEPQNLKHLRALLELIREGDDLDDIVYGQSV